MDLAVRIANTVAMTERARRQWHDTPRWHLITRYQARENYLGWQQKLNELRREKIKKG